MIFDTLAELEAVIDEWNLYYLSPEDLGDYPHNITDFFILCEQHNVTNFFMTEVNEMYQIEKMRKIDNIINDIINE